MNLIVDLLLGFAIGISLGLLGGGGSILTVPALVYVVGQTPQAAVTASLMIVGANSMVGAFMHRSQGTLNWKIALIFGGVGMAAAYLAAGWSKVLPSDALMVLFALLMLAVGLFMILKPTPSAENPQGRGWLMTTISGVVVGLLTGFLGVGGGFLIVPALVMLVGLPIRQAVGTSLIVIAMNSLAGFLGHLQGPPVDLQIVVTFVTAGLTGALVGARLAKLVHPEHLRKGFAFFVIGLAVFLLYDNMHRMGVI
ncbi:MAG: sulfite exporter TauE/SafE family protein [Caldilineaceae bacterium]|nr:sulfite exporter TauE/SafE family protein [Caldilineaceae bacterium]